MILDESILQLVVLFFCEYSLIFVFELLKNWVLLYDELNLDLEDLFSSKLFFFPVLE